MIRVLEDQVVNKIAAGEVVERPASVVKELVENALDAGARQLRVELRDGGRELVRVTDDGSGMDRTDATLCLERHATSKIRSEQDLFSVQTLGFRGEAIPSIASVGRFELQTRRPEDEVGTRLLVDGGRLVRIEEIGCPVGTRISVRSLFYNIPARRKFLRTETTELSHCLEAVRRQVLVRPELDVEVVHGGRTLLRAPAVADLGARAAEVLGKDADDLVPIDFSDGPLRVWGLISPLGVHQASGTGTYLYVNGRYVKDPVVRRGVREAYRGAVPRGRFPVVVLLIEIPPEDVDVNVHPAKTEVRFQHARDLVQALADGVRTELERSGLAPRRVGAVRYSLDTLVDGRQGALPLMGEAGPLFQPEPAGPGRAGEGPPASSPGGAPPAPVLSASGAQPATGTAGSAAPQPVLSSAGAASLPRSDAPPTPFPEPAEPAEPAPEGWTTIHHLRPEPTPATGGMSSPWAELPGQEGALPVPRFQDLRVLGQLDQRWVLAEGRGSLVVIDQAAAHRAITAARLRTREGGPAANTLSEPLVLTLAPAPTKALLSVAPDLLRFGLELESFGGDTLVLKGLPGPLAHVEPLPFLESLGALLAGRSGQIHEADVLAALAHHAPLRANQVLSPYEMRALMRALDEAAAAGALQGAVFVCMAPSELHRRFQGA